MVITALPAATIVGQPNVGKSALFNRIIDKRLAVVEDRSGVTCNRNYAKASWLGHEFNIVDTGGITWEGEQIEDGIHTQTGIAMEEADIIVMITGVTLHSTDLDERIARILYRSGKPVILAVNKADDPEQRTDIYGFYSPGLGDPIPISSTHGTGIGDLLDAVVENLPPEADTKDEDEIALSVIGYPNVGKSSIINAMLGQKRVIAANEEGTTRDAVDILLVAEGGTRFRMIDTAGIRRHGKVYEKIEKYSVLRAQATIQRSDVVCLILDASTDTHEQDKHMAGFAHSASRGMIIVANRWDLSKKDSNSAKDFTKVIREEFQYLDYVPIIFVSVKTDKNLDQLPDLIKEVAENQSQRIQSSVLNGMLIEAFKLVLSPLTKGKRLRAYYMTQVVAQPPTSVVFVDDLGLMHFSYKQFLINQLRDNFDFTGTPIKILPHKRK